MSRDDGACRQVVKTSDCGSDMHGFESHQTPHLKEALARVFFYALDEDENPFDGSSEERAGELELHLKGWTFSSY